MLRPLQSETRLFLCVTVKVHFYFIPLIKKKNRSCLLILLVRVEEMRPREGEFLGRCHTAQVVSETSRSDCHYAFSSKSPRPNM